MSIRTAGSSDSILDVQIRRDPETQELEFTPAKGSRELRDALHYKFPLEDDYKSRLRKAILQYCGYSFDDQEPLGYQITRNTDNELVFSPAKGSQDLRDALHYRFPEQEDYGSRIQEAILVFCNGEESSPQAPSLQRVDTTSSTTSRLHTSTLQKSSVSLQQYPSKDNYPKKGRRQKRPYSPAERRRIYNNRGNVCAKHAKAKEKCDPDKCPDNLEFPARNAARLEAAHAAQPTNFAPAIQHRPQAYNPVYGDYATQRLGASEPNLHTTYSQPIESSNTYMQWSPINLSASSQPTIQNAYPESYNLGLSNTFYDYNNYVVPSNVLPENQSGFSLAVDPAHTNNLSFPGYDGHMITSNVLPENQGGLPMAIGTSKTDNSLFSEFVNEDMYAPLSDTQNQSKGPPSEPEKPSLEHSKSRSFATIMRRLGRFFKANAFFSRL